MQRKGVKHVKNFSLSNKKSVEWSNCDVRAVYLHFVLGKNENKESRKSYFSKV